MNRNKRAWSIVLAGMGINLSFGVLYAWSIFAANLRDSFGWSSTQASLPYTMAVAMFAVMMIFGGRLQDRYGPRAAVTLAGILVGGGMILASLLPTVPGLALSFGLLAGSGIGLGYSATTPVAIKWFPPERKGLISGMVVGGFGAATLYIAPLTNHLIENHGVFSSFRILGACFLLVVVGLAQTLRNPSEPLPARAAGPAAAAGDMNWKQMIRTPQFYQLWVMFLAGALAGLMIIGHLSTIARVQTGRNYGFMLVAFMAVSNALGRPIAGTISDRLGRAKTMMILYIAQGAVLLFFSGFSGFVSILFGAAVVTFAYGAMLSVYPSAVGDFYGTRNLGLNYGVLFTAWGAGGQIGPIMAGRILDATGGYDAAYRTAAALCFLAAVIGFTLKPVKKPGLPSGSPTRQGPVHS